MPNRSKIYLEGSTPKCLKLSAVKMNFFFFTCVKRSLLKNGMIKGIYNCVVKNLDLFKENIWPAPLASEVISGPSRKECLCLGSYWTVNSVI